MSDDGYEYPFRIEDWHGEVVADDLDTRPAALTLEEVDSVYAALAESEFTSVAVWSALRKLPDSVHGVGGRGDVRPHCQKCGSLIGADEPQTTAFGYFYHTQCIKMATDAYGSAAKREMDRAKDGDAE